MGHCFFNDSSDVTGRKEVSLSEKKKMLRADFCDPGGLKWKSEFLPGFLIN